MNTIEQIFDKKLFRIPDYQRGYAWKENHLDDFWQDLQNLQDGKKHYTGDITLEQCSEIALKKFKDDQWLIESEGYQPFYVIDGQQRLTTVIILLQSLLNAKNEIEEEHLEKVRAKYLYRSNRSKQLQSFIFGYEVDDPSYEYLKTKIFKQESTGASHQLETSYTNNLGFCKAFFDRKLIGMTTQERGMVLLKVTTQLLFDLKFIGELDKFVVFETMNNRGKALTNLEKLKNRFIYLSTLLPKVNNSEAENLRKQINDVWKSCYEFLGKNKNHVQNDDIFLRNHFIIYHWFKKEKGFPFRELFKEVYTVQKTLAREYSTTYKELRRYIGSLQKAAKQWYIINNPEHACTNHFIEPEEAKWLEKVNRLGLRMFGPLTLSVYLTTEDAQARIEYLKAAEAFIFLNYVCANKRGTFGMTELANLAGSLYNVQDGCTLDAVIDRINSITYGNEEEYATFTTEAFQVIIRDQFGSSKKHGYYDWGKRLGAKYLLFEYEEYLRGKEEIKVKWSIPDSIEHIYPQNPEDNTWLYAFKGFTKKQKHILCNSLGNLLLLNRSKNSMVSNRPFKEKCEYTYASGNTSGYKFGSHSEIHVAKDKEWNARKIYLRGIKILEFFQKRWNVAFNKKEMKTLLLIDEALIKKIR